MNGLTYFPAFNAYDGVAFEIYVSGCYRNCPGCHNPDMQDFNFGKALDLFDLMQDLTRNEKWFDIISFLGGDLLCQDIEEAKKLVWALQLGFPQKRLWLFTGAEIGDIDPTFKEAFDVIKTGVYVEELRQNGFPASSNQRLLRKGIDY